MRRRAVVGVSRCAHRVVGDCTPRIAYSNSLFVGLRPNTAPRELAHDVVSLVVVLRFVSSATVMERNETVQFRKHAIESCAAAACYRQHEPCWLALWERHGSTDVGRMCHRWCWTAVGVARRSARHPEALLRLVEMTTGASGQNRPMICATCDG